MSNDNQGKDQDENSSGPEVPFHPRNGFCPMPPMFPLEDVVGQHSRRCEQAVGSPNDAYLAADIFQSAASVQVVACPGLD